MAQEISKASTEANELGLTPEELGFYDALTKPAVIKDLYQNDELVSLTHELTDLLRKSRTIDWEKKTVCPGRDAANGKASIEEI